MSINYNDIIVFDFETGSKDPNTCEPLSLAASVLDCRTLELKSSNFEILIQPTNWDNVEAEALAVNKLKREDIETKGVPQRVAWESFSTFVKKFNKNGTVWSAPVACGHNIKKFDMTIVDRMCKLYGPTDAKDKQQTLFNRRDIIDLLDLCFLWFENNKEPDNYKLDTLRDFFGLSREGAHSAIVDVQQTAQIVSRFLKFHRRLSQKASFRGAFLNEGK